MVFMNHKCQIRITCFSRIFHKEQFCIQALLIISCPSPFQWKFYLAIKGTLASLADLITKEIEQLDQLEHQSLSSDLAQGFALNTLTYIFGSFLNKDPIKRVFKGRLLSTVLHGYLRLRR